VNLVRLGDLPPGKKAKVVEIRGSPEIRMKLLEMGLTTGIELKVLRNAPLKDPMEIEIRGYNLSIRRTDAKNVIVEVKE